MFPVLETERLLLREIVPQDAPHIYSFFSDDRVTKLYGINTFTNIEEAESLIASFSSNFDEKRGIRWGIEIKEQQGLIGTIGFNLLSPMHRRAEIGYELHPNYWRKGYAKEALQKLMEYGLNEMALIRIGAVVFIENIPSNELLKKLGFQHEGVLKQYMYQNGAAHDVNIYSILKD